MSDILSTENPLFFVHSKVTISYMNSRSYLHQVLLTLTHFIKAVFEHHKTAISRSFLLFCFFVMNCLSVVRVRGTWVYTEVMSQTALLCNLARFYQILVTVKAKFARESGKTTCT